jgi:hypothetical protein
VQYSGSGVTGSLVMLSQLEGGFRTNFLGSSTAFDVTNLGASYNYLHVPIKDS